MSWKGSVLFILPRSDVVSGQRSDPWDEPGRHTASDESDIPAPLSETDGTQCPANARS